MQEEEIKNERKTNKYVIPKIIYEGQLTTRAGSPTGGGTDSNHVVDPADLFRTE